MLKETHATSAGLKAFCTWVRSVSLLLPPLLQSRFDKNSIRLTPLTFLECRTPLKPSRSAGRAWEVMVTPLCVVFVSLLSFASASNLMADPLSDSLQYSGLPSMYNDQAVQCTWEGDKSVLSISRAFRSRADLLSFVQHHPHPSVGSFPRRLLRRRAQGHHHPPRHFLPQRAPFHPHRILPLGRRDLPARHAAESLGCRFGQCGQDSIRCI